MKSISKPHFRYLDVLKAYAIMGVIAVHSIAASYNQAGAASQSWFLVSVGIDTLFRISVPLFVMVSGAIFLSRKEKATGAFYINRLLRIGVPLLFWSIAYGVWGHQSIKDQIIKTVVFGTPYFHLYFLYIMLGLYTITPALRAFLKSAPRQMIIAATVGSLMLASAASFMNQWFLHQYLSSHLLSITFFLPYIGYYLAGYLVHTKTLQIKWQYGLLFVGLNILGSVMLRSHYGLTPRGTLSGDYLSPTVIALALVVFCLVRSLKIKQSQSITALARASFGMYLSHILILEWLQTQPFIAGFAPPLSWAVLWTSTFCLAYGYDTITRRLPLIKYSIGVTA